MTFRDLTFESIETAVNGLLNLDPSAKQKLTRFYGKCVAIELRGTGVSFFFLIEHDGALQVLSRYEDEPDCRISGSPLDLMRASDKSQGPAQLFAGHVEMSGDTELGHRFSEALGSLEVDWEEHLSHYTGDIAAHELGRFARKAFNSSRESAAMFQQHISEYVTEEARLVPHRYEADAFLNDIDQLRDDVERLEARIKMMEQQIDTD